jgi:hypothetical protein
VKLLEYGHTILPNLVRGTPWGDSLELTPADDFGKGEKVITFQRTTPDRLRAHQGSGAHD